MDALSSTRIRTNAAAGIRGAHVVRLLGLVLVLALVLAGGLPGTAPASADEGFDLMRQITSQWVKPNIMLVFDRSGSMAWPVDTSHYSSGRWYYRYSDRYNGGELDQDFNGALYLGADSSVRMSSSSNPVYGTGQGYWARVAVLNDSWAGRVYRDDLYRMYVDPGDPGWHAGDVITIEGMPDAADNGNFKLTSDPTRDYQAGGSFYYYFTLAKELPDGTFETSDHQFQRPSRRNGNRGQYSSCTMYAAAGSSAKSLWYFVPSSRMSIAKNVLGDSIYIYEPSVAPTNIDQDGRDYWIFYGQDGGPTNGAFYDAEAGQWVNWANTATAAAPAGDPDFTMEVAPTDIVRRFSDTVNWGLLAFSTAGSSATCPSFTPDVDVDSSGGSQDAVVSSIEAFLTNIRAGGLEPSGRTPTRGALESAKSALDTTAANDPQQSCGRTYGVILMTDGQSNNCNPGNTEWGAGCPTTSSDPWSDYPPGKTDELWSDSTVKARTWVIGVSPDVARCELNLDAYWGRTDASAPEGDAGFDTAGDTYLPANGATEPTSYDTSHGDYAYFTSAVADLRDAFVTIVGSMGAGDYSTAPPSVSTEGTASLGSVGLLASTEYPSWEGHLRAFDLALDPNDDGYDLWDAATVLATGSDPDTPVRNNGVNRHIYTWNPDDADNPNALVEVTLANASTLDTICRGCGITPQVVDFIRGNNGNVDTTTDPPTPGQARPKELGALINSTPAIIQPPNAWIQGNVHAHAGFATNYSSRHTLVWVGDSDGMAHAFDLVDGAEVIALIPPDLLDNQVRLFDNYQARPTQSPLGEPGLPADHVYGVANSIRFGDVYFPDEGVYKTVLFITEGPGGTGVHAIDVTHPYPGRTISGTTYDPDPDYSSSAPVQVLWSTTADGEAGTTQLADLGKTWSVPALGPIDSTTWAMQIGQGFNPNPNNTTSPVAVFLDPTDGSTLNNTLHNSEATLVNASSYLVTNQAFADAVMWKYDSGKFQEDNVVNEGVQADLNGHLRAITKGNNTLTVSNIVTLSPSEPIYYPPAVAGYPERPPSYSLYAFASGSFFETSSMINGPDTGLTNHFTPEIYVAARSIDSGDVSSQGVPLKDIPVDDQGHTLGRRSQVTAPPILFTPKSGSTNSPFALYLVYDPDAGTCVGKSYIVRATFDPENLDQLATDLGGSFEVYLAGDGTSGGFALAGDKVFVAQSAVGESAEAHLVEVPNLSIPIGGGDQNVTWWVELQ